MVQQRPPSPEKQLLSLIENPSAHPAVALNLKTLEHSAGTWFSQGAWRGRLTFFKDRFERSVSARKARPLDLKKIKKFFLICILALTVFFIQYVVRFIIDLRKLSNIEIGVNRPEGLVSLPKISETSEISLFEQPFSDYWEKSRQKNIFKMGPSKPLVEAPSTVPPAFSIQEAVKHLKLVGISWSSDPYAMIEDTAALRTLFVKTGETVGTIKVQVIFKDKVVLSCEGQEIELR